MFQLYDAHGPIEAIPEATSVTVGVFDGVHRGHQHLLARMEGARLAVTLTAHPSFVLGRRTSEYWLDDPDEHLRLLFQAGAKYVALLPFTREVAQLSACDMAQLLHSRLNMRTLVLGYDSRFGSKSHDDFDSLPRLAERLGFRMMRGEPFLVDGEPISSSRIRSSLADGRVEDTAALLGRRYSITGTVLHGRGVGHTLGFPTANIDLGQTRKMLPADGVYAVRMTLWPTGGSTHLPAPPLAGMANLGAAPTFGIEKPTLEVHLIDFDGDLYGKTVNVEFVHRLRDIMRFDSAEALEAQLQQDLKNCRRP